MILSSLPRVGRTGPRRGGGMADASVSKTDEGNLVRVRLPLSAPRHSRRGRPGDHEFGRAFQPVQFRGGVQVEKRQASLFEVVVVSVGLVLIVALIYQLAVGGIRI